MHFDLKDWAFTTSALVSAVGSADPVSALPYLKKKTVKIKNKSRDEQKSGHTIHFLYMLPHGHIEDMTSPSITVPMIHSSFSQAKSNWTNWLKGV